MHDLHVKYLTLLPDFNQKVKDPNITFNEGPFGHSQVISCVQKGRSILIDTRQGCEHLCNSKAGASKVEKLCSMLVNFLPPS
jgi:hypothetical protein